ncbi:MAG: MerR family transcriptional regulator, partial [Pannonibacter sp.]
SRRSARISVNFVGHTRLRSGDIETARSGLIAQGGRQTPLTFKPHRSGTKSGSQVRLYGDDTRVRIAEVVALRRLGFTVAEILKGKITRKQYEAQLEAVCAQRDELEQVIHLLNARLMEFESQRRA